MEKKERKGRLDKGSASNTEFVGFGAFATENSTSTSLATATATATVTPQAVQSSSSSSSAALGLQWSPVYTGSNAQLTMCFKKINQKRDFITKARALSNLAAYLADASASRKDQATALCHFAFVYHNKLSYDASPSVRAACLHCIVAAQTRIPRAFVLLWDAQPELYGVTWCAARADAQAEVRTAGMQLEWSPLTRMLLTNDTTTNTDTTDDENNHETQQEEKDPQDAARLIQIQNGISAYVQRILRYGRARSLHDALFTRKKSSATLKPPPSSKQQQQQQQQQSQQSSREELSESEREQADERFERVVGCALTGMEQWIATCGWKVAAVVDNSSGDNTDPLFQDGILWKTLQSSKSTFRRKTYTLVTVLCQHAPQLVYGPEQNVVVSNALSKQMLAALSQEKEATNIPSILEMFLVYMASFPKNENDANKKWFHVLDATIVCKHLNKMLRKACYGASTNQWGPSMLPLVALLPNNTGSNTIPIDKKDAPFALPLAVLSSMWEGREVAIGPADTLSIVAAVAECASFLLMRRLESSVPVCTNHIDHDLESSNDHEHENATKEDDPFTAAAKDIAAFVQKAIGFYLSLETISSAGRQSHRNLMAGLARDLHKLELISLSSSTERKCALAQIQLWFWQEGVRSAIFDASGSNVNSRLTSLVLDLQQRLDATRPPTSVTTEIACGHYLSSIFCEKFRSVWMKYRSASKQVPDEGAYDIMIACLRFCGVLCIFEEVTSQETEAGSDMDYSLRTFVMTDLLQWIIVHASPSGQAGRQHVLRTRDYILLRICLSAVSTPLLQKIMWQTILREMIATKCDLESLVTAFSFLITNDDTNGISNTNGLEKIIRCDEMDEYAVQVATDSIQQYRDHYCVSSREEDDESDAKTDDGSAYERDMKTRATFLRTCAGLASGNAVMLVSQRIINEWIASTTLQDHQMTIVKHEEGAEVPNPVLATLLALVSNESVTDAEQVGQVVLASWREGGPLWYGTSLDLLLGEISMQEKSAVEKSAVEQIESRNLLCERIIIQASDELQKCLKNICTIEPHSEAYLACTSWSEKAWRLLQLCKEAKKTENAHLLPVVSLSLFGLSDLDLWKESFSESKGVLLRNLYLCLVHLLQHVQDPTDRLSLLVDSPSISSMQLAVSILLSLSTNEGNGRSAHLLSLLGGREGLPPSLILSWCHETIKTLASDMHSAETRERTEKVQSGVSLLAELSGLLFNNNHSLSDTVSANDVRENGKFWYITDKEDESKREHVQIVKIHRDDFPRLYFTIRPLQGSPEADATTRERQTVAERLRRQAIPVPLEVISKDLSQRQEFEKLIFEELVRPILSSKPITQDNAAIEAAGECIDIIISKCGLLGKGGLGSTRYEVFQIVSSLDKQIVDALSSDSKELLQPLISSLASAMGFGRSISESKNAFGILRYEPDELIDEMLFYFEDLTRNIQEGLDRVVLRWLAATAHTLTKDGLTEQCLALLYKLAVRLLEKSSPLTKKIPNGHHLDDALLVLKVLKEIDSTLNSLTTEQSAGFANEETALFSKLINSFASVCTTETQDDAVLQMSLGVGEEQGISRPTWYDSFRSMLQTSLTKRRKRVVSAAILQSNSLVRALFVPEKRWGALLLINAIAKNGEQIHAEDEDSMNEESQRQLIAWQEKLHEEEAGELEADVYAASHWLPEELMKVLENLNAGHSTTFQHEDDTTAMGYMLCWLSFLEFLDSSAAVDSINRGAFSSYINNCGSVGFILTLALSYASIENERTSALSSMDVEQLLSNEESLDLPMAATVVLFRTVEVLPTLSKKWWTDDCPKYLSSTVSQFVQNRVAPETLKRELLRIKNATDLGEVSVSGSTVSREVTATYTQDECTLSLVIQIPPMFPLRNIDVDGRKTLGIPEKRWQRWALQIRLMLNSQDGTLLDAIVLWKKNVDKEFEGVEPCPVCYSVLSVKSHELPNLECKTCSNRFHSNCLHKWFQSSGKNDCVLCQQPWSGTRIQ